MEDEEDTGTGYRRVTDTKSGRDRAEEARRAVLPEDQNQSMTIVLFNKRHASAVYLAAPRTGNSAPRANS